MDNNILNDFLAGKPFSATANQIKSDLIKNIVEQENAASEYKKGCLSSIGCGWGCCLCFLLLAPLTWIVRELVTFIGKDPYFGVVVGIAASISFLEYLIILAIKNYISNNRIKKILGYSSYAKELLAPIVGLLSQDMAATNSFEVQCEPNPIEMSKYRLSSQILAERGIAYKRGLSVHEAKILDFNSVLADGTKVSFNIIRFLARRDVYKKRRAGKHTLKEKITIKAVFAVPTKKYSVPENMNNSECQIIRSDKCTKITIKQVLQASTMNTRYETKTVAYSDMANACIDSLAYVYSMLQPS